MRPKHHPIKNEERKFAQSRLPAQSQETGEGFGERMTDTQRRWRRPRKDSGENPFVFVDTQHWDRSAPFTLLDSYKDDQGVTGSSGGWGGGGWK